MEDPRHVSASISLREENSLLVKKKKSLLLKLAFSDPDCAPEARENFGPRLTRDGGGTIKQTGEVGLFILEKRSLRRDLLKVCKYQI